MHIIYRPYRLGSNDQRILTNKRGSHSSWDAGVAKFSWAMIKSLWGLNLVDSLGGHPQTVITCYGASQTSPDFAFGLRKLAGGIC